MTPAELTRVLALLKASYPRQTITADNVKAYSLMLVDLDHGAVKRAVVEHIAQSQWFPSIAELRERATCAQSIAPDFDQAWAEVLDQIRRVGSYGSPSFSHQSISAAVDAIGWRNLCLSETPGVERAAFRDCFTSTRRRAVDKARMGRLLESHSLARLLGDGNER